ncbi:MAG: sugar ABC transporter permease [Planctomycetota bacterium]
MNKSSMGIQPTVGERAAADRRARRRNRRALMIGLAFLAPNILGVAVFTVFPVVFSLVMAFSNWDLTQHNMFKEGVPSFIGLDSFVELIEGDRFFRFFGNTLFFMMGIPVAVAGSLGAAMLLSKDTRAGGGWPYLWLLAGTVLLVACVMLTAVGLGATAMTLLFVGTACGILLMGVTGGLTFYRTLFYTPHFVAGVATMILWKKLYSKDTGPINDALQPVLNLVGRVSQTAPLVPTAIGWGFAALLVLLMGWGLGRLRQMRADGELGGGAAVLPLGLLAIPAVLAAIWDVGGPLVWAVPIGVATAMIYQVGRLARSEERFRAPTPSEGFGTALVFAVLAMVGQFILLGFAAVALHLPGLVEEAAASAARREGDALIEPPGWLTDRDFAKPALMTMGFWAAIGSNNMLLYLAALTNVPGELYEAADIDGASPIQRFWNITWPQLAPTTFFIFVMSTIGGLQGGFEMARVMTQGGPDGATTTLSYFIYTEGFEVGRLGFASAVAWTLFILVFGVTLFNWKFGNKYVND